MDKEICVIEHEKTPPPLVDIESNKELRNEVIKEEIDTDVEASSKILFF